jgi:ornithine--oxo-acid transaminase
MPFSIAELLTKHRNEKFSLHEQHLNNQMVRVLKTIGYDRNYQKAIGQYLYDQEGNEYLDLLSGFGVFGFFWGFWVISNPNSPKTPNTPKTQLP